MSALAFAFAVAVGLSLGLLGGGGSILTVPILVYVVGFAPKEAIATSLVVVGASSVLGVIGHWRAGNVNLGIAGIFGVVAMAGTFVGSRLAVFVSGTTQLVLFALVMLAAAAFMLRGSHPSAPLNVSRAFGWRSSLMTLGPVLIAGLATGAMTGLLGVGGGFLIVPALVLLLALPMKQAVGTSLLVIAMNSAIGFIGYADQVTINWQIAGSFAATAALGIVVGSALTRAVSAQSLRGGFAFFLVGMALFVLYQNRFVLLPA
jgi:uncharacterized protein